MDTNRVGQSISPSLALLYRGVNIPLLFFLLALWRCLWCGYLSGIRYEFPLPWLSTGLSVLGGAGAQIAIKVTVPVLIEVTVTAQIAIKVTVPVLIEVTVTAQIAIKVTVPVLIEVTVKAQIAIKVTVPVLIEVTVTAQIAITVTVPVLIEVTVTAYGTD